MIFWAPDPAYPQKLRAGVHRGPLASSALSSFIEHLLCARHLPYRNSNPTVALLGGTSTVPFCSKETGTERTLSLGEWRCQKEAPRQSDPRALLLSFGLPVATPPMCDMANGTSSDEHCHLRRMARWGLNRRLKCEALTSKQGGVTAAAASSLVRLHPSQGL